MTKLNLVILLIINLISTPNNANNKKASDLNLYLGKNIKDKNSLKMLLNQQTEYNFI